MVSKARLDFPDPETPVTTVMALWGISKLIFLRLWTRAPETAMDAGSSGMAGPVNGGVIWGLRGDTDLLSVTGVHRAPLECCTAGILRVA